MAKEIPIYSANGKDGGTAVVTRSKNFMNISLGPKILINWGIVTKYPKQDKMKSPIINLIDSLKNLNLCGFGNKMLLISYPLKVLNPILITKAYPAVCWLCFPFCVTYMTEVPSYKVHFLYFFSTYSSSNLNEFFYCGFDSPVRLLSFINTYPCTKMQSHGIFNPSVIWKISPGTKSFEFIVNIYPPLITLIVVMKVNISLSFKRLDLTVYKFTNTVIADVIKMMIANKV
jgi:hypothetical protein